MAYSRTRLKQVIVPGETRNITSYVYDAAPAPKNVKRWINGTVSSLPSPTDSSQSDVVTPNYKKRIAAGEIINSPMESVVVEIVNPILTNYSRANVNVDVNGRLSGWGYDGVHVVPNVMFGTYLELADADSGARSEIDLLISQMVMQAHAGVSKGAVAGLVSMAEMQKTVSSLALIVARVINLVRAAKRLDVRALRKEISFKELTNRYMELRYAIRPLVYDALGVLKALDKSSKDFATERSTSRAGGIAGPFKATREEIVTDVGNNLRYTRLREYSLFVEVRAGVLSEVDISVAKIWGLDTPLGSTFELIPFSFIADWFFNFSEILSVLEPKAGIRELASWVSVKETQFQKSSVGDFSHINPFNYDNHMLWSGSLKKTTVTKKRIVNPQLSYFPAPNVRLDALKLLDLAIIGRALLRSVTG